MFLFIKLSLCYFISWHFNFFALKYLKLNLCYEPIIPADKNVEFSAEFVPLGNGSCPSK